MTSLKTPEGDNIQPGVGPPLATPAQVREFVRRFEPNAFLEQIAYIATREGTSHRVASLFPRALNPWVLGDLARYVLLYSSSYRRRVATITDVLHGANLVNGIAGIHREYGDQRDVFLFLYRTAVQQFPYHYSVTQRLGRLLVMHEDLPRSVPRLGTYDLADRFRQVSGVTLEQFMWTTFVLYAVANRGEPFTVRSVVEHGIPRLSGVITGDSVTAVMALVSCTRKEFVAAAEREMTGTVADPRERFALNPLIIRPAVHLNDDRYVVPEPRLLLRRLLDAPYYVLLDADGGTFATYYGSVFEEYVGWLLGPHCGGRLRGEFEYGPARARVKTSDWMILEEDGVAFLECKTGRLPKDAKTTAPQGRVAQRFASFYGHAAQQLSRVSNDTALFPELDSLRGGEHGSFIVLLDPLYWGNSPLWDDARAAAAVAEGLPEGFRAEIVSVDALEELAPALAGLSLVGLLREKRIRDEPDPPRHWDWEKFAQPYGVRPNLQLEMRWERFVDERVPAE